MQTTKLDKCCKSLGYRKNLSPTIDLCLFRYNIWRIYFYRTKICHTL